MDELIVSEKDFSLQLIKWKATGRSLQNLVTFTKCEALISVYVVTVDNKVRLRLDKQFTDYQSALGWYGLQIDNII